MLTLCIGFVGRIFHKKYCEIHHAIIFAILEAIFINKMADFFKVIRVIFENMRQIIVTLVGAGWMNWKKCSGVLCDKKMPVKLKGKVYRTVVRPAMLYGAETWATTKRQESRIEVNEMRMLRWMCGVTRKDKIRNEHIRGTTKVAQASRKITERRLKWYGHVMRMEDDHVVKRVMTKAIPGKRKRGRPKTRWKDVCKRDMQTVGLREGDAEDRAYWKEMINNHSGDPR